MESVTISYWLIVSATLLGPILAVQVQKWLEIWRERRNRKLWIFYALMATRAARLSDRHVEALNSIQLEYYSNRKGKAKRVKDAWTEYHSHLGDGGDNQDESSVRAWWMRGDELFTNLLFEMAQYLRYDYNRVDIQKSGYSPKAFSNKEQLQEQVINRLANVLSGQTPIKITLTNPTEQ